MDAMRNLKDRQVSLQVEIHSISTLLPFGNLVCLRPKGRIGLFETVLGRLWTK
jgi:hypothetical protein